MSARKLLINNIEAYVEIAESKKEIKLNWIVGNIYKFFSARFTGLDAQNKVISYNGRFVIREIKNLNGFDYSVENPDYTLIKGPRLSDKNVRRDVPIAFTILADRIYLMNTLELVGTFVYEDFARGYNSEEFDSAKADSFFSRNNATENINVFGKDYEVYEELELKQPFKTDIVVTNETGAGSKDGTVQFAQYWGGTLPLEFRLVSGPVTSGWQAGDSFDALADGDYQVRLRDADGNVSDRFDFTVLAWALVFSTEKIDTAGGSDNGQITFAVDEQASNATGPYEYSIDGGTIWNSNPVFTNLAAGSYDCVVRDSNLSEAPVQPVVIS